MTRYLISALALIAMTSGAVAQINLVRTYNAPIDGNPHTGMFINAADGTFDFTSELAPEGDPAFAAYTHLLTADGLVFANAGYGIFVDGFTVSQFGEGDVVFAVSGTSDFGFLASTGSYSYLGLATDLGETVGYLSYIYGDNGVRVNGFAYLEPDLVGTGVPVVASIPGGGGGNAALRKQQQRSQRVAAERARRR